MSFVLIKFNEKLKAIICISRPPYCNLNIENFSMPKIKLIKIQVKNKFQLILMVKS